MILRRARHRIAQFIGALRPTVDRHDRGEAYVYLNDAQRRIFEAMMLRDQQHGIEVFRRARAAGGDRELLTAALLHDCGKGVVKLWQRIVHVILGAIAPGARTRIAVDHGASWRQALWRLEHHPELGAAMVAATIAPTNGADPEADIVRLIRQQEAPSPDERLAILQVADEA